jgi:hypothetical protein
MSNILAVWHIESHKRGYGPQPSCTAQNPYAAPRPKYQKCEAPVDEKALQGQLQTIKDKYGAIE